MLVASTLSTFRDSRKFSSRLEKGNERQSMKKVDLVQTIAILANLGVIGGLVFVGLQLRQTQRSLDLNYILTEVTIFQELQSRLVENPQFAEVMSVAGREPARLTPAQRIQVLAYLEEWLSQIATYRNSVDAGLLSEDGLARRMGNECWFYNEYRELFEAVRERRDFGFDAIDEYCAQSTGEER